MFTIVGLGNPGKEYDETRHNIGRAFLEHLVTKGDFDAYKEHKKANACITSGYFESKKVRIVLPNTFMNNSGKVVSPLKLTAKHTIIVHDDSDLPVGSIKLSCGKGPGGHRGVDSMLRALRSKNVWRIRIGIQKKKRIAAENIVLKKFTPAEKDTLKKLRRVFKDLLITAIEETPEKSASLYNQ